MKKSTLLTIVIFLFISISSSFCQINWQQLEGPYGGWVNKITKGFGDDIIAIASKAYKTTDKGLNWVLIENESFSPLEYFFHDGLVYGIAHGEQPGKNLIFISSDSMKTWTMKSVGIENQSIRKIMFKDNYLLALTDSGVYKSSNGGDNWSRHYYIQSLQYNMMYDIVYNSKGMIFLATVSGLYRSKDKGTTWELMNPTSTKMKGNVENIILDQDEKIFLNTTQGMFRSYDDGDTWKQIGSGIVDGNMGFILNPSKGKLIIGKTWGGILSSDDYGDSWKSISENSVRDLVITNDGKYMTPSRNGVLIADSLSGEWELRNKGINETTVSALYLDKSGNSYQDDIIVGTQSGTIYKSSDKGVNWTEVYQSEGSSITSIIEGKDNWLFASSVWGGVMRSSDFGNTWELAVNGLDDADVRSIAVDKDGNLFAGTFSVIYKSTNNGTNWNVCLSQTESIQCSTIVINSKNQIFAGTMVYGVLRSTNGGTNWTQMAYGMQLPVAYLAVNKADEVFAVSYNGHLYSSTNDGASWTNVCNNIGIVSMFFLGNDDMLAGVDQNHQVVGMLRSKNKGKDWAPEKSGLGELFVNTITANSEGVVYVGTGQGIFRSTQSIVSVDDNNENINFGDVNIFPNPATGDSRIQLSVKPGGFASVELYDLLGNKVRTIATEYLEEGEYYYSLGSGELMPGFYYLKCTIDGRSIALRFVVH